MLSPVCHYPNVAKRVCLGRIPLEKPARGMYNILRLSSPEQTLETLPSSMADMIPTPCNHYFTLLPTDRFTHVYFMVSA